MVSGTIITEPSRYGVIERMIGNIPVPRPMIVFCRSGARSAKLYAAAVGGNIRHHDSGTFFRHQFGGVGAEA